MVLVGAGLVVDGCAAAVIAAATVYHLYISRLADMPSGKKALRAALMAVLLLYAGLLLSGVNDSKDHFMSRLEETETKLWQMEETMEDYKKQNLEMNSLVGILSKNPTSIKNMSYKVQGSDGTDDVTRTELSVTMKDDEQVDLPCDHQDEAPTAKAREGTPPPPSHVTTTVEEKRWTWRDFFLPPDHALFLDCVDGELTLHVQPEGYTPGSGEACSISQSQLQPFLHEFRSNAGVERTLFLARPGEEHAVPESWPPRDESSPVVVQMVVPRTAPGPIALTADVVVHTRALNDGMINLIVAPRDALRCNCDCDKVVSALTLPSKLLT